jgi:beta-aspartyl-dipeptidase (metallo-type)
MGEALALARRGATVDLDLAERDLARWYAWWRAHDGPMDRITLSSDADSNAPDVLLDQVRALVVEHDVALEHVLPLVTSNTARVLQLARKGHLEAGCDADVVVLDRADLAVREVIVLGRRMVVDGAVTVRERFLTGSSRRVTLVGDEALPEAELPGRVTEPAGAE